MKTSDTSKISSQQHTSVQRASEPFFSKEGQGEQFGQPEPFFSPATLQPKLAIGQPNDKYEQEADRVATQVVNNVEQVGRVSSYGQGSSPAIQAKCDNCEQEEQLQRKEESESVMAKSSNGQLTATNNLQTKLEASKSGGQPLSNNVQSEMGAAFGTNFQSVRVHTGGSASEMSGRLNAKAFTQGNDIYFNDGMYNPEKSSGKKLLAHELTHTLQQSKNTTSIQRDTQTVEQTPGQTEASLPTHPNRSPHEIVLLSGGPVSNREDPDHDKNPLNFATAARIRIERLIESAFSDQRMMIPEDRITWVVMRPPYRYRAIEDGVSQDKYISDLLTKSLVNKRQDWDRNASQSGISGVASGSEAIRIHFVDSSEDFVEFMNNGAADGERALMKIGRFEYFGHGLPGTLWFTMGWNHLRSVQMQSFGVDDVNRLDPSAFLSYSQYRSWSCNTATPAGRTPENFVETWVERLGGTFVGAVGRTSYEVILSQPATEDAVVLTGVFPRDATDRRNAPTVGTQRGAYWTTTTQTATEQGPVQGAAEAPTSSSVDENWAHESELLDASSTSESTEPSNSTTSQESSLPNENMSEALESAGTAANAGITTGALSNTESEDSGSVCEAEVVPFDENGIPGSEICSEEGSGQLEINQCLPQEGANTSTEGNSLTDAEITTGIEQGYYPVHFINLDPDSLVAIDEQDEAWQPFLREIAGRAYRETLDTDSIPGTLQNTYQLASNVRAHGKGFRIGVVERNGKVYYKIFGAQGANAGIRGRWYAANNTPRTSPALNAMMHPRAGLASGLRSGSIGIGGLLTVGGTTLDYAIDPDKDLASSDFAVDVSLDLVKSAGASAAGSVAGAAVTGWLAGGAMGATIGSAAPVVGTIIGFVVGVLAAMAIEYFIGDFRASVKAWLRNRHNIRNTGRGSSSGGRSSNSGK